MTPVVVQWLASMTSDPTRADRVAVIYGDVNPNQLRATLAETTATADDATRLVTIGLPERATSDTAILRALLTALDVPSTGRSGVDLRRDLVQDIRARATQGERTGVLIYRADLTGGQLEAIRNVLADAAGTGMWMVLAGPESLADRIGRRRSLRGMIGLAHYAAARRPPSTDEASSLTTTEREVKS